MCSDKSTKLIFRDFQGPTIKFQDFPGLENEILKFHDFPGFSWPVRTLIRIPLINFTWRAHTFKRIVVGVQIALMMTIYGTWHAGNRCTDTEGTFDVISD